MLQLHVVHVVLLRKPVHICTCNYHVTVYFLDFDDSECLK